MRELKALPIIRGQCLRSRNGVLGANNANLGHIKWSKRIRKNFID